jgi:hypothetical protein
LIGMQKFDPSCGLSRKEIEIIKFLVKQEINVQLPILSEHVETRLFFEGREAWMFRWFLQHETYPIPSKKPVFLKVVAKLKKEFHQYQETEEYSFSCKIKRVKNELYNPKITINRNA